jgi:RNA polymerase sigma-70 factor (sigma-E family)
MTFDEFTTTHLRAVLAFAGVLTGQRATAEDIAQEVLLRAYARWDKIGCLDRPEFYVRKMVLNEFLSWQRRSRRMILTADAESASGEPDHAVQFTERAALLAELSRLPRRQRAVIVLRYYEGRSDAEIAELLGCAPSTIRSYATRALATLRIGIQPESRDPRGLAAYVQREI